MYSNVIPLAVVIPTRNRVLALRRTLRSLATQSVQPAEVIVVDASDDSSTHSFCLTERIDGLRCTVSWLKAELAGAASQRNQGIRACSEPIVGFFDDDILFEPECIARLWCALLSDERLGGVNAMITNQRYQTPGWISRLVFWIMAGQVESSYAGRVLGPAVNVLPEDRDDLPEVVPVEWLNTTCTVYRREALPEPAFPGYFTGYSLMEDLTLSLMVRKSWKLANARTARIYHDSQPATYKSDPTILAAMQFTNRHYVMTRVLGRDRFSDYVKLILFELFCVAGRLQSRSDCLTVSAMLRGKVGALLRIIV